MRGQVSQAVVSIRGLVDALSYLQNQFGGRKTLGQIDNAAKLVTSMHALGDAIGVNLANVGDVFDWIAPVARALDSSPDLRRRPSLR